MRLQDRKFTSNADFKDLFFDVDIYDSNHFMPDWNFQKDNSKIIVDKTNDRVLNFVSKQYKLERNSDLILPIYNELSKFFEVETRVKIENNARFFVELIIKNRDLEIIKNDIVHPSVIIFNSYNNSVRRIVSVGFYRQVCTNGLMGFQWELEEKRKHTGDFKFDIKALNNWVDTISNKTSTFKVLTDRKLTDQEAKELIKKIGDNKKIEFPTRLLEGVEGVMKNEMDVLKSEPNNWLLYNAFNYQLNHSNILLAENKKYEIDRKVLDFVLAN